MSPFENLGGLLRPELYIGQLCAISAQSASLSLTAAGRNSGSHYLGSRYGNGEVGEFVLIEGQTALILGRMIDARTPDLRHSDTVPRKEKSQFDGIGSIQLLGTVAMDNLKISPGIAQFPRLGDRVYAAPHPFIASLPRLMDAEQSNDVFLRLGSINGDPEGNIEIKPEKLLGRHCAILGSTGGGKSWTTARIIEECIKFNSKIILLDATSEYRSIGGEYVAHLHLGSPTDKAAKSLPCSLPPTSFIESDFIALFEPSGKVQGPKLRAAIRSLRLAALAPSISWNGFIRKIDQSKSSVLTEEARPGVSELLDDPSQPFDVSKLVAQIEQECVYPEGFGVGKGNKDSTKWGSESGEFSYCLALVSRINGVLTSPAFECVFRSTEKSLTAYIDAFMKSKKRLLRICVGGVSFEYNAREIISNVIGRHLLRMARSGSFRQKPLIAVVDEAHNFLGRHIGNDDTIAKLDAFEIIAKEGRKYGLTICLSTQRPRDITEGVLSQMGTLVVHRLTNDRDRDVVERACGEIDRSASSFLPNLKPGEAAIIGADFPIPLTVQIEAPTVKPHSDGPNYQANWQIGK
ncbi:cell division protein FtsK [Pseudoxanthomonas jiangsuensis]|uniref:ATP-binding protein n=1 Tax=Pseudoxanthomonas jiangsuensis TaxID=619688 RepID=UPI001391FB8E|nr:ATP-binding protein [Pseudoxanthomonas jiangsuensis]KAF1695196.1 cell division protein FtsK [Pseudoxanthomonas jiangsuensis]